MGDKGFYKKKDGTSVMLRDVAVLSLGTGSYNGSVTLKQAVGWGQLQWIQVITDIMMKGVSQTTDYEAAEMICGDQYVRLNIDIAVEKYSNMTDACQETRDYLIQQTKFQVLENEKLMKRVEDFFKPISPLI